MAHCFSISLCWCNNSRYTTKAQHCRCSRAINSCGHFQDNLAVRLVTRVLHVCVNVLELTELPTEGAVLLTITTNGLWEQCHKKQCATQLTLLHVKALLFFQIRQILPVLPSQQPGELSSASRRHRSLYLTRNPQNPNHFTVRTTRRCDKKHSI
ncbi:hypothetical protein TSMEX_004622 [Taenia solium]|eukprot:TsM_000402500 transcript=TsM_000402500 gene=TsM_000402500